MYYLSTSSYFNDLKLNPCHLFVDEGCYEEGLKTSVEDIQNYNKSEFQLTSGRQPWRHFKLPPNIVPIHYDILLNPSLEEDTFNGNVSISVHVTQATRFFIVHAKELDIFESGVYDTERQQIIDIKRRFYHTTMDYFVMETFDYVEIGKYVLSFKFSGAYDHGDGLYKEEYEFAENDKRYLAMTFFAPNFARKAFPCFDEPSLKATFSVGVFHDSTHFAISNMPVKSEIEMEDGRKLTEFETTPRMSTYLLCVIVCDFEYKETISENGVMIRAYASKRTIDKIDIALNWTSEILTYFENYLNVSYPLKKLDIISLPEFNANGMENWGLITYAEQKLLIDNTSSTNHKLEAANLIAHELAHMWFGDLVTMDWWDDTWLNEGFATHFAWKGVKHVLPEYLMIDDNGIEEVCKIMSQDDTIYTRPVIRPVTEIIYNDVYSTVVYKKGASLLRMLERYIGEKDFIKGISNYLKKYAYGSVKTKYLWREINELNNKKGIDVSRLMHPWFTEKNFPCVEATCQEQTNCSCDILQHRFLLDTHSNDQNQSHEQNLWNIPLSYTTSESTSIEYILLNSKPKRFLCKPSKFRKFNSHLAGYYSVKYNEKEYEKFNHILDENLTIFEETDRLNLLFDAFTLASNDKISYVIPLNISRYLKKEEYHNSWSMYLSYMDKIKEYISDDKNTTRLIKVRQL